jgi:hypothetical protein
MQPLQLLPVHALQVTPLNLTTIEGLLVACSGKWQWYAEAPV